MSAASLWFPLSELRAPVVSALSPEQAAAYVVTTFDVWGGSATTYTGVGLDIEVPGGPDYAVAVIPCALLLLTAGVQTARASTRPRSVSRSVSVSTVTSVVGPAAAGALVAIAVCQLLAYEAALRPSPPGGLYGGGEQRPEGALGWAFWLLAEGALLGIAAGVHLHMSSPSAPKAAVPPAPPAPPALLRPTEAPTPPTQAPAVTDVDPAVFRRPAPDHQE